jgi:1-acyl-sn-glycerol-3-phosphate acyltransferase
MFKYILTVICAYISTLLLVFIATFISIVLGIQWGSIPHKYLQAVLFIQKIFAKFHCIDSEKTSTTIERDHSLCVLSRSQSAVSASDMQFQFDINKENALSIFDVVNDFASSGLQSIVQDDVSGLFSFSPAYVEYELTLPILRQLNNDIKLHIFYMLTFGFRAFFLFPLRLLLLSSSFGFAAFWCLIVYFFSLTKQRKTWIAVTYCRLFCAGTGVIAKYHNEDKIPKQPGIAVSNHLSPNDIQIICANVNPNRDYLYTVTGQKHTGIIWVIESLVERINKSIWFDRGKANDRQLFIEQIMDEGRRAGPVLLFPEGYCTNNTHVLQFRKAVFTDDVTIYPIAIKQDARFGDSFWSEDLFYNYLIRLLTSWAAVYDIYYLDPQQKSLMKLPMNLQLEFNY